MHNSFGRPGRSELHRRAFGENGGGFVAGDAPSPEGERPSAVFLEKWVERISSKFEGRARGEHAFI